MLRPPHRRSRAALDRMKSQESVRTIIIALVANVVIAVAKLISGIFSGSTALLAEAAHSFADSSNEVLLGISLRRAMKPADEKHPLGHGRERFLWAFMAAVASFLIGGCFSIAMAIHELTHPSVTKHTLAAWIVLGIAFVADGFSWVQSIGQARDEAREHKRSVSVHLMRSSDPIVRAIVVEDSAALIGLVFAAAGLFISQMTHSGRPDAIASLLIGLLMAVTAFGLARPLADFLVGRSLPEPYLEKIRSVIDRDEAVAELVSVQAVYTGPEEVIVAAKVRPSPDLTGDELAKAMDDLDAALRRESPFVADVYIDVTHHRPR
ncbi:MAG TPA: cation diffusion facilitator family transporter [Thermoanaerobaculia bacterium]|jgi:cation diffusion facilitator family transporter